MTPRPCLANTARVQYRQDDYFLVDHGSTNGTFLGNSDDRLREAHKFAPGDRFRLGPFIIEARLSGAALDRHSREQELAAAAERGPDWVDWEDVPGGRPAAGNSTPATPEDDFWELPGEAPDRVSVWSEDANASSNDPSARDIFGEVVATNEVDWSNASWAVGDDFDPFATDPVGEDGFAPLPDNKSTAEDSFAPLPDAAPPSADPFAPMSPDTAPTPAPQPASAPSPTPGSDPFGGPLDGSTPLGNDVWPKEPTERTAPPASSNDPFGALPSGSPSDQAPRSPDQTVPPTRQPPPQQQAPAAPPAATPPPPAAPAAPDAAYVALLTELGVASNHVSIKPDEAAAKAGRMLRHLLAGLMILLEARARAKDEMGAAATQLRFDGNNPLKFARNVDQALQMMLNPKMRGYMEAEEAIEDSYRDLQAHQIATLKAMQGALRETLDRFSPAAIKARTKEQGLLSKVLPGQREAALWKAYEEQFSGVAEGSAEAFLEVFSKEFRRAYEEATHGG